MSVGRVDASKIGEFCGSRTCKPNSVRRIAPAGRSFLWAEHYCAAQATYPEVVARRAGTRPGRGLFSPPQAPSLFGLAPCGVCPARRITATAVRSYRTFSPLPRRCRRGGIFSVALSVEWTRPSKPGRAPSRTLSGTLLCGVRTFLPRHLTQRERPSGPAANRFIIADGGRQTSDARTSDLGR